MKVALVGGASETRWMLDKSDADEFWTVNWSYKYDWIGQIDRLFEVHPVWLYASVDKPEWAKPRRHWEWLTEHVGYPVYLQHKLDQVPSSIRYPIEDVVEVSYGDNFLIQMKDGTQVPSDIFGSSMDFMMGIAIQEGFDEIELVGIEMGSSTEYRYQRESFAVWCGIAIGKGIRVIRAENSALFRHKRYGYEGGQMIFRQDLERLFNWNNSERAVLVARVQQMEGMMQQADKEGKLTNKMSHEYRDIRDQLMISTGWAQCLTHEIKDIDLEEVEPEIVNPYVTM